MKLGIDLGGTNLRIAEVDNSGIQSRFTCASPGILDLESSLEYLYTSISSCITKNISGIGIGVPSVVDAGTGTVFNVANIPAWKEVPLKYHLENRFQLPVVVNNDSNCFTVGEKHFGRAAKYDNIVGITLGTGVGAGIIINGALYCGVNTGAGEIGAIPYLDATFEDYCAGRFFKRVCGVNGEQAARNANDNIPGYREHWREFARHLSELIKLALLTYDPECIVIGGGISASRALFEEDMLYCLSDFIYPNILNQVDIHFSTNPDSTILGAAALSI